MALEPVKADKNHDSEGFIKLLNERIVGKEVTAVKEDGDFIRLDFGDKLDLIIHKNVDTYLRIRKED